MEQLRTWLARSADNPGVLMDLIRIYLGIGLFVRGVLMLTDTTFMADWVALSGWFQSIALMHYVALAHLFGGLLLAFGLLTRFGALIQIPILMGAVFYVHLSQGLMTQDQSLEFAALVLFLLVLIFLRGAGRFSMDYYWFQQPIDPGEAVVQKVSVQPLTRAPTLVAADGVLVPEVEAADPRAAYPCTCAFTRDKDHFMVSAKPMYSKSGWLRMLAGVRAGPIGVHYQCRECGYVVDRSTDPEAVAKAR